MGDLAEGEGDGDPSAEAAIDGLLATVPPQLVLALGLTLERRTAPPAQGPP
jgi:hypothetical protein